MLGLGAFEVHMFLTSPTQNTTQTSVAQVKKKKLRFPASIQKIESNVETIGLSNSHTEANMGWTQLDLDCTKLSKLENKNLSINNFQNIQIKLSNCDDHKLGVINQTNGYEASVFELNENTLGTDYIPIKTGMNLLKISINQKTYQVSLLNQNK